MQKLPILSAGHQAFGIRDMAVTVGNRVYSAIIAPLNDVNIDSVTQVTLTFTDQKNVVKSGAYLLPQKICRV